MQIRSPFSSSEGIISPASLSLLLSVWVRPADLAFCFTRYLQGHLQVFENACMCVHCAFLCETVAKPDALGVWANTSNSHVSRSRPLSLEVSQRKKFTLSELAQSSLSCLLIIRPCSYHSPDSIFIWSVARDASSLASPTITQPLRC